MPNSAAGHRDRARRFLHVPGCTLSPSAPPHVPGHPLTLPHAWDIASARPVRAREPFGTGTYPEQAGGPASGTLNTLMHGGP